MCPCLIGTHTAGNMEQKVSRHYCTGEYRYLLPNNVFMVYDSVEIDHSVGNAMIIVALP